MKLRNDSAMTFVWDSLFRRSILEEHCLLFDTAFKHGNEDIDLCERFAVYCNKMVVNPKSYYNHYTRIGVSTSSKYSDAAIKFHLYLLEKSNTRYRDYGIDAPQSDKYYASSVTKQLIVSSCQKLNDAGKLLDLGDKLATLRGIHSSSVMLRYLNCDARMLRHLSTKLYLYCILFQKKHFRLLLLLDKYSRRFVYWLRMLKAK